MYFQNYENIFPIGTLDIFLRNTAINQFLKEMQNFTICISSCKNHFYIYKDIIGQVMENFLN